MDWVSRKPKVGYDSKNPLSLNKLEQNSRNVSVASGFVIRYIRAV